MSAILSSARQSNVYQTASPVRSVALNLSLQSLPDSRVVVFVISTVSGGSQSHIPTTQIWDQVNLIGVNGFARLGDYLVSAWISKPGVVVYQGGSFQFAGLLGTAPEYAQIFAVELTNLRLGAFTLSLQSWNQASNSSVTGSAVAIGQAVRGVLALAIAEGTQQFTQPASPFNLLSQTANSGFFSSSFSASTNLGNQSVNDQLDVSLPFTGSLAESGLLLFNVLAENNSVDSVELGFSTTAFLAYPQETFSSSAYVSPGGDVSFSLQGYIEYTPGTLGHTIEGGLTGEVDKIVDVAADLYGRNAETFTTDAYIDLFHSLEEEVFVGLLGTASSTSTQDGVIVGGGELSGQSNAHIGKDIFHLTNSYIVDFKQVMSTDALLWDIPDVDHTTDAFLMLDDTRSKHDTDAATLAYEPPTLTHSSESYIANDSIIAIVGWELQDIKYEKYPEFSPDYSHAPGLMTVTTSAKRDGSLGTHGMRIDNDLYRNSPVWWLPYPCAKFFRDALGTEEVGVAGSRYSELWATFWFRHLNIPAETTDSIFSDQWRVVAFTNLGVPIYASPFDVRIGSFSGVPAIELRTTGQPVLSNLYYNVNTDWHKMEVRAYTGNPAVRLTEASSSDPVFVEVYLDNNLILGGTTPHYCDFSGILGIQQSTNSDRYRLDFDDYIISTRRLSGYDLSVKVHTAKANGTYNAWTSTPAGDYTDVASIPPDPAKYKTSTTIGQKASIKVYSGADTDPYPATIHAASFNMVRGSYTPGGWEPSLETFVKQGVSEVTLYNWKPHEGWRALLMDVSPIDNDTWANALYDLEYGVHKVVNSTQHKILNLSVCLLVSPFSYNHNADAITYGEVSATHTTSASLGRSHEHSTNSWLIGSYWLHSLDAALSAESSVTHSTDSNISGESALAHGADSFLDQLLFNTADALIVNQRGSVMTADALLTSAVDQYASTDSIVGAQVDHEHSTHAMPYVLVEQLHSTDSFKQNTIEEFHLADGRLIKEISATHTTNSLNKGTIDATFTTDGLLFSRREISHFADAMKLGERTALFSTGSFLMLTVTLANLHGTNSLVSKDFSTTFTTSAVLKILGDEVFSTYTNLQGENNQQMSTNSRLVNPYIISADQDTDSYLIGTVIATSSVDSLLKATYTLDFTTSSAIELLPEVLQLTDAVLQIVRNTSSSSNSVLWLVGDSTFTTSAFIALRPDLAHTTQGFLLKTLDAFHSADGILAGEVTQTHTVNSRLLKELDLTFSSNAYAAFDLTNSSDAFLLYNPLVDTDVASSLFGTQQPDQQTNAFVIAYITQTHTGNSGLLGEISQWFTVSVAMEGVAQVESTNSCYLAFELMYSSFGNTAGEAQGQHGAWSLLDNDDIGIFEDLVERDGTFEGAFG